MVLPKHGRDAPTSNGLAAACTEGSSLCMVVGFAVWHALVVEEGASVEWLPAVPADEALWMPLSVECRDVVLHDGGVAASTLGSEHVEVVVSAVRLAILLVETIVPEGVAALRAEEVIRVPRLVQRRHAFVKDGTVAVRTARREEVVVVWLTVRLAVPLEEVAGTKLLVAVRAGEVLRVPRPSQGCDYLANDGFIAGTAAALLRGGDALLRHV